MSGFDLGLSAIRAAQVGLRTASNNLANATTPGYHRQRVDFAPNRPVTIGGLSMGTGVSVTGIQRLIDTAVESALLSNRSDSGLASARLSVLTRLDALLAPGNASLSGEVTRLFDSLEQLSSRPQDAVLQQQVVKVAEGVTRELNSALTEIRRLQTDVRQQAEVAAREVTQLGADISKLNQQISLHRAEGNEPNDLLDHRDQLLSRLSELIDVAPGGFQRDGGPLPAAAGSLLIGAGPVNLNVSVTVDGSLQITSPDWDRPVVPTSGKLAGLLEAHNEVLSNTRDSLLNWFDSFRRAFDDLQATGLSTSGPYVQLDAAYSIKQPNSPLSLFANELPVTAGDLYVTVTNTATGERRTHQVAINPVTHSLSDIAALLDALPGLDASVPATTGRLSITAAAGYRFDFAGRVDQQAASSAVTGTAVASFEGLYSGAQNASWEIVALDSGTVGVSAPLRLQVRDTATGATLAVVDAGLGYEANATLSLPDGVVLKLATGTIDAGDTWTIHPVANADETGLLSALGLQSFFTGGAGGPFGVNPGLRANPSTLALSRSGLPGDGSNLHRFIALRNAPLYGTTNGTVEERLATVIALVGLETQFSRGEVEQLQAIGTRLAEDRDSISGVDPNEETLSLMRFQQSFQAASRFLSIIQTTMDELMTLIG